MISSKFVLIVLIISQYLVYVEKYKFFILQLDNTLSDGKTISSF